MTTTEQTITDDRLAAAKQLAPFSTFEQDVQRLVTEASAITVKDINDKDGMKASRAYRLDLKNLRCAIERRRKELVEDMTKQTRSINSAAAQMKELIEPLEEKLLANEEFAERAEAARIEALTKARVADLSGYCSDPYNFNAGRMTEEAYQELLAGLKAAHEARVAEIARQKAEQEAKVKADAEALAKAQAEAAEAKRKLDAERVLAEIREREERQKREAAEKALSDERGRIAAEAAAVEEANRKAAMAPDKEKLVAFADVLAKLPLPELSVSTAGLIPVREQMRKFIAWIVKEASKL